MGSRIWTTEEVEYLIDTYGNKSIESIANYLGRSKIAVVEKAQRVGLGSFFSNSTRCIPINTLSKFIGSGSGGYIKISWVRNRNLPIHKLKRLNKTFEVIYLDEFWEWAYNNQSILDFSKFEKYALGPEPKWVDEKRNRDITHGLKFKKTPWTKLEDDRLKLLLNKNKYSYSELSTLLNRTTGAIQRRICDLNIKERPIKADNHSLYSKEEYDILCKMIKDGENYEAISEALGRSSKAIRGRVFNVYLTENLDKVRMYIGDGAWGDNRPTIPVRHMRLMQSEEKKYTKSLLSELTAALLNHAKDISGVANEYRNFWQKDMCMHWDKITGCTAGETSCDTCTHFQRIQPQFCKRCGITFFERQENLICERCRIQRQKSAARKYYSLFSKKQLEDSNGNKDR